jgi:hypothetical protein
MVTFLIEPYVGVHPIKFGMAPAQVEEQLGKPDKSSQGLFGARVEERPDVAIGYCAEDGGVNEIVFSPGARLVFQGHDLFAADPLPILRQLDDSPFEWVGFIIFLKLGIRVSGFHDNDESQKAIGVVRKGHWDEYVADFVPFK